MLDIRFIRENQAAVETGMKNRGADVDVAGLLALDDQRRRVVTQVEGLKAEKNARSKQIGEVMKTGGDADAVKAQVREMGDSIATLDEQVRTLETSIREQLLYIPNVPSEQTPVGSSEEDNPVVRSWGEPKLADFELQPHWDLGQKLGLFDLERGAKLSGSGFPLFTGAGARLERALIQFMLDLHTEQHGYAEVAPPFFCNEATMTGTGQLPKFAEDMYAMPLDGLFAIPTAEVPITNLFRDELLNAEQLPIKYTGYTPCFRREAGSYGAHVRGLNRLHQFDKVEIVRVETQENSYQALEEMVEHVKGILAELELPYRILRLCGGDLGFTSALTYDFEVWSAAQQRWLEISSVSNFETFQANRLKLRYKNKEGKKQLCHTLNGSALALPRVLAALLENNQSADGIAIPKILQSYTGFDRID